MLKDETLADLKAEINIMASLDHPNIVRIVEYFESKYSIYLILELLSGGELLDRLYEQKDFHYSEKIACRHIHTILNAINHCHRHNIAHRDLKLENFLFESRSDDAQLKLIDFGLSQYFQPEQIMHKAVGTPYYVAPEVMEGSYTAKCDIWSLGVITYMLLSGKLSYDSRSEATVTTTFLCMCLLPSHTVL
jgi:calcium-dependent protein kinase